MRDASEDAGDTKTILENAGEYPLRIIRRTVSGEILGRLRRVTRNAHPETLPT